MLQQVLSQFISTNAPPKTGLTLQIQHPTLTTCERHQCGSNIAPFSTFGPLAFYQVILITPNTKKRNRKNVGRNGRFLNTFTQIYDILIPDQGPPLKTSNIISRLGSELIHSYICCLLSATHIGHGLKFIWSELNVYVDSYFQSFFHKIISLQPFYVRFKNLIQVFWKWSKVPFNTQLPVQVETTILKCFCLWLGTFSRAFSYKPHNIVFV